MEGWYEFGYDGFPSGEARRRFYRQRDDPCDSEEEQNAYDNEGPVNYYPIHDSEESSSVDADEIEEEIPLPHTSSFPLSFSILESYPGRFGNSAVVLKCDVCCCKGGDDAYFLFHGGVLAVSGKVVNLSEVLRVDARESCDPGHKIASVVTPDASLAACIRLTDEGLFGAVGFNASGHNTPSPPRRFGHCAVVIPNFFAHDMLLPMYHTNCELHLTLVVGGAFCDSVPKTLNTMHIRGLVMYEPWLCMTVLRGRKSSVSSCACGAASATHSTPVAQWTVCCPIACISQSVATPRVFATLTAWPVTENDPKIASYAYLGGSANGWDPLPVFGPLLLHVDATRWRLSATFLETFGQTPVSRFGHSATVVNSEELYVFGGIGARREYLNDLVVLNCSTRVWREVFVPSLFAMPSRAFHSSILLTSCKSLIILGGEADGCHEPSVWRYDVDCGDWSLMVFPLLERCLLPRAGDESYTGRFAGAVRLLCERERSSATERDDCRWGGARKRRHRDCCRHGDSSAMSPNVSEPNFNVGRKSVFSTFFFEEASEQTLNPYYFAAMHGSLLQVVAMKRGIVVFGGTKSPSVTPISWISARDFSLKESTALWICTHRPLSSSGRKVAEGFWRHNSIGALHDLTEATKSDVKERRISLIERSVAEYQLERWRLDARKRLRER